MFYFQILQANLTLRNTIFPFLNIIIFDTDNFFSEELILESVNPQYDDRLFIELHVQYKKIASSEHIKNML